VLLDRICKYYHVATFLSIWSSSLKFITLSSYCWTRFQILQQIEQKKM
jgi:hypothetical protein